MEKDKAERKSSQPFFDNAMALRLHNQLKPLLYLLINDQQTPFTTSRMRSKSSVSIVSVFS